MNLYGTIFSEKSLGKYPVKASCVFIKNCDRVLSVSRKNNCHDKGLPGGKVENNETYEECARRELLEETGIKVGKLIPIFSACGDTGKMCVSDRDCNTVTFFTTDFFGEIDTAENGSVEWIHFDGIKNSVFQKYNSKVLEILRQNCLI